MKTTRKSKAAKATKRPPTAAEKARWAEERAAKVEAAKGLLTDGVRALQTSDEWADMLRRVARSARVRFSVSRYSFANQILVAMQAPHATMTAGFAQWLSVGRHVRKGERALMIRQPKPFSRERENAAGETETVRGMAFGIAAVFSYEQTDGDDLPEVPELCSPVTADGVTPETVEAFRRLALALDGAPVASVEIRARRPGDPRGAAGWYRRSDRSIVVLNSGSAAGMFRTLAHEIAHALMHGTAEHHDTPTKEVEAESVAFIVCEAMGIDTAGTSFPYVASWAGKGADAGAKVLESGERITRAATAILDALEGSDVATSKVAA